MSLYTTSFLSPRINGIQTSTSNKELTTISSKFLKLMMRRRRRRRRRRRIQTVKSQSAH
jgi:hypothetical protein